LWPSLKRLFQVVVYSASTSIPLTMSDNTQLYEGWEGEIVPKTFQAGFIVLSYAVSWIGALTTLEVINRRTAGKGLYNWYETRSNVAEGIL
jgi:hypothetical protein